MSPPSFSIGDSGPQASRGNSLPTAFNYPGSGHNDVTPTYQFDGAGYSRPQSPSLREVQVEAHRIQQLQQSVADLEMEVNQWSTTRRSSQRT